jgi:hypothetical protein
LIILLQKLCKKKQIKWLMCQPLKGAGTLSTEIGPIKL